MKRMLLLPLLSCLLVITVPGADIHVIQPQTGKIINTGSTLVIQWTVAGSLGGTLKILLKRSSDNFKVVIKQSHPPTASPVQYTLPHNLAQGQYFVRINFNGGFARSGDFTIKPGLMAANQHPGVTFKKPGFGHLQKPGAVMNVQLPDHAVINSFTVNGVATATNTNRINCYRQQGIACSVSAGGAPPLQYKYEVNLLNPYDGYRYGVYASGWVNQSTHSIQISENSLYSKLFPNGVPEGGTFPVSVMGEVEVQVRMVNQTANPAHKELPITFFL